MRRLRRGYGAGPLHLVALAVCFVIAAYALVRIFQHPSPIAVVLWLAGAIVAHDFFALPLYTALHGAAGRVGGRDRQLHGRVPVLPHVVVPTVLCAFLFVVWFPLILGLGESTYRAATGLGNGVYLGRWLAITAGLYLASALVYAVRRARSGGARPSG